MKKTYIVSVAVYDRNDNDLTTVTIKGDSENGTLASVREFFKQEAFEGHDVRDSHVMSLDSFKDAHLEDETGTRIYATAFTTIETETSYEAYTRSKLNDFGTGGRTKEQAFAETFLNELNHQPFNAAEFGIHVCHQHPTLQQYFFRLLKGCIKARAQERAYSHDERNRGAVNMCLDLTGIVDKYPLPIR